MGTYGVSYIKSSRVRKKEKYKNLHDIFNRYFIKLKNGFVIFKDEYLKDIRKIIENKLNITENLEKISYKELLKL